MLQVLNIYLFDKHRLSWTSIAKQKNMILQRRIQNL